MQNSDILKMNGEACSEGTGELHPRFAQFLWDYACTGSTVAAARLQKYLRNERLEVEDLHRLARFFGKTREANLLLTVADRFGAADAIASLKWKRVAHQQLGKKAAALRYALQYHASAMLRKPWNHSRECLGELVDKFKPKVARAPLDDEDQRSAAKELPKVIDRMRQLVEGQRTLILGAGPTAMAITDIPSDVVVFCINRSLWRLHQLRAGTRCGSGIVWALGGCLALRHWEHVLMLSETIDVDWVLLEFFLHRWREFDCSPRVWKKTIEGWRFEDRTSFLPLDDHSVLNLNAGPMLNRTVFSWGINLLKYVVSLGPREVYLAGVDLGYAGRKEEKHAYFYERGLFRSRTGATLVSRQFFDHLLDEGLVSYLAKQSLPIYCVSSESRAADYLPVKPLQAIQIKGTAA